VQVLIEMSCDLTCDLHITNLQTVVASRLSDPRLHGRLDVHVNPARLPGFPQAHRLHQPSTTLAQRNNQWPTEYKRGLGSPASSNLIFVKNRYKGLRRKITEIAAVRSHILRL